MLMMPLVGLLMLFADGCRGYGYRRSNKCPRKCRCLLEEDRKMVVCDSGGMTKIPTSEMESDIHIIVLSSTPENPNYVTLGRIFLDFTHLEEIYIVNSNIPAIGDSSFAPGKRLKLLDLSHNNITLLRDLDFNGLRNLQVLNLSDNNIAATPSAPFRLLSSLKVLSLARNKLQTLVPRFFYMLPQLDYLDLSGNPLQDIDPENLKDVKQLRSLLLANCQLSRVHSLLYQQLPFLEVLDLQENMIQFFSPEEFRHLRNLRVLKLSGNFLKTIVEKTFDGHNLDYLGLSRNHIEVFQKCAFCNTSIHTLDVSNNRLESFNSNLFSPLAYSLQVLDVSYNKLTPDGIEEMMSPLFKLRNVSLSGMQLSYLRPGTFSSNFELISLDLSHNHFENLSDEVLHPVKNLEDLDLSMNRFKGLHSSLLGAIDIIRNLKRVQFHSNPWHCSVCDCVPFVSWLNASLLYDKSCQDDIRNCLRCVTPPRLSGQLLRRVKLEALEPCPEPVAVVRRDLAAAANLGLYVAVTVIIIIVAIIIITILAYRRKGGASYYTREDESRLSSYDKGYTAPKKRVFLATVDEGSEPPSRSSLG